MQNQPFAQFTMFLAFVRVSVSKEKDKPIRLSFVVLCVTRSHGCSGSWERRVSHYLKNLSVTLFLMPEERQGTQQVSREYCAGRYSQWHGWMLRVRVYAFYPTSVRELAATAGQLDNIVLTCGAERTKSKVQGSAPPGNKHPAKNHHAQETQENRPHQIVPSKKEIFASCGGEHELLRTFPLLFIM